MDATAEPQQQQQRGSMPSSSHPSAAADLLAPLQPAPAHTAPEEAILAANEAATSAGHMNLDGHGDGANESIAVAGNSGPMGASGNNDSPVIIINSDDDGNGSDYDENIDAEHDDADEGENGSDDEGDAWDSESVISDIVLNMSPERELPDDAGADGIPRVKPEWKAQRLLLLRTLNQLGPHEFISRLLESDQYTPKGLCEALGGRMVQGLDMLPEDHILFYRCLGKIISHELSSRTKLDEFNTVDDAVELLKTRKNVLVLTGAGISTSLGIPDFRSKDGLYNMLQDSPLSDKVDDPQDVFALATFHEDPTIFFTVAKFILSPSLKYSPTHSFIRLLQDKGKLLTNYTQNIDNFEACAGIDPDRLVHCHGSFATATCIVCKHCVPGAEIEPEIHAGRIPRCKNCLQLLERKRLAVGPNTMKRKKSWNTAASNPLKKGRRHEWEDSSDEDIDDDLEDLSDAAAGVMKPDIVFFGEDLPKDFHERLSKTDKDRVDLVLVMGTSLMVAPVSDVPGFLPPDVPQIYISREPCRHINFDIQLLGDCDAVVAELCRRAGWQLRHHMIPDPPPAVDVVSDADLPFRHRFVRRGEQGDGDGGGEQRDEKQAAEDDGKVQIGASDEGNDKPQIANASPFPEEPQIAIGSPFPDDASMAATTPVVDTTPIATPPDIDACRDPRLIALAAARRQLSESQ